MIMKQQPNQTNYLAPFITLVVLFFFVEFLTIFEAKKRIWKLMNEKRNRENIKNINKLYK